GLAPAVTTFLLVVLIKMPTGICHAVRSSSCCPTCRPLGSKGIGRMRQTRVVRVPRRYGAVKLATVASMESCTSFPGGRARYREIGRSIYQRVYGVRRERMGQTWRQCCYTSIT